MPGARAPAAPVQCSKHRVVTTSTPETPGIPARNGFNGFLRAPRRRVRLVTVVGGLMAHQSPVELVNLRQLDTSNGCQDHTALPYAATSFVYRAG